MNKVGETESVIGYMRIWSFCFVFFCLTAITWGQENPKEPNFKEHMFVGYQVANKNLGVRRITTDLKNNIMIPRGVIKTICNRSYNPSCETLTKGTYWVSQQDLSREKVNLRLDLLNFQIKILLPIKWYRKIKAQKVRSSDQQAQSYSYQYLKFVKEASTGTDGSSRLVQQLLKLANPEAVRIFSKEEWFFPDRIVQVVQGEDIYSSSYYNSTNTELMTIAKDIQENRKFTDSSGLSSLGQKGVNVSSKLASQSSQNQGLGDGNGSGNGRGGKGKAGLGTGKGSKGKGGRGTSKGSKNQVKLGQANGQGGIDSSGYYRDYHNHYNEEILEELRGMHSILMKMGQKAHLYSNHQDLLISKDSLEIEEQKNKPKTQRESLDSLELAELEKEKIGDVKDMNRSDVFQKAFGRKPKAKPMNISVRLVVDGEPFENVKLDFNPKRTQFTFRSAELADYMDETLLDEVIDALGYRSQDEFLSEVLKNNEFEVQLNEAEFSLTINIPGLAKKIQLHDYANMNRFNRYPRIKPAFISAFMNLNFNQDLFYNEVFIENDSLAQEYEDFALNNQVVRDSWMVRGDAALNILGWVGETDFSYIEPNTLSVNPDSLLLNVKRRNTRLIRDIRPLDFRLTAGDISPSATELDIGVPQLLGVNINRRYGRMNRERSLINNNSQEVEVVLDRPARIETWVNGRMIRSENYGGGVHLFRGFSGGVGLNNLKLIIQHQDGRIEERNYGFTQGIPLNLLPGVLNFDLSTGLISRSGLNSSTEYELNQDSLTSIMTVRLGAHPYLTLEAFGLLNSYIQSAGGGFVWQQDSSSRTQLRVASSLYNKNSLGYRAELVKLWFIGPIITGFSAAYHTANYVQNIQNIPNRFSSVVSAPGSQVLRPEKYMFRGNFAFNFSYFNFNSGLQANVNRSFAFEERNPVEYNFNAELAANPITGLNLSVGGSANVIQKQYNPQLNINVTYFFNRNQHNVFAMNQLSRQKVFRPPTLETETITENQNFNGQEFLIDRDTIIFNPGFREDQWLNTTTLGWNWSQGLGFNNGSQYDITAFVQENNYSVRASSFQTGNRGQLLALYTMNDNSQTLLQSRNHLASIRAETSLSFADGLMNIGRPIRESFVLVNTKKSLRNTEVQINPNGDLNTEYSRSWSLLSAQFGEVLQYRPTVINLGLIEPKPGMWLDQTEFVIDADYKRGYALAVGKKISIIGRGRLLDQTDSPVSRIAFVVVSADNPDKTIYESFTNKRGVFQIGELEPGEDYLIRFGGDSFINDLEIEVPSDAEGIIDFGKLKVNHQKM